MATKPTSKPLWTAGNPDFATVTVEPSGAKKQTGWFAGEHPANQTMNWLFSNLGAWVDYFDNPIGTTPIIVYANSPYSMTSAGRTIGVDTSGGNVVVTLPSAASNAGIHLQIIKTTSDANTVTVSSSDGINGAGSRILTTQFDFLVLKQVGTSYAVLGSKASSILVRTLTTATTLTASDNGATIFLDSSAGSFNVTLPSPVLNPSFGVHFKDPNGMLATNKVTLVRFGAELIENVGASYDLNSSFGYWRIFTNGTNYFVG